MKKTHIQLTKRITLDLVIFMTGFGVVVGIIFPFFAKVTLGLPSSKVLSPLFFSLCILAGILVGLFNYYIFRLIVYRFVTSMDNKILTVHRHLDDYYLGRDEACKGEDCRINITSEDNFGRIAMSFNQFVSKIQVLINEEKNLDKFLKDLQKSTAIEDVADIILRSFMEYFGGEAACVFGVERGKMVLLKSRDVDIDMDKIKQEYLFELFRENRIAVHSSLKEDNFTLNIGVGNIKPESIAFIPLQYQSKNVGLAVLLSRGTFSRDFHNLESRNFIQQAAPFLNSSILVKSLENLAALDELTNVFNRRFGIKRYREEFERARRHQLPISIAMIDLDNFKTYNDTYGHPCGDHILKTLAEIAEGSIRSSDFILRYGGEEFMIILPGASTGDAYKVLERIRKKVETHSIHYGSFTIHVTFSGGISGFPAEGITNMDTLTQRADDALYKAKGTGKNKVVISGQ